MPTVDERAINGHANGHSNGHSNGSVQGTRLNMQDLFAVKGLAVVTGANGCIGLALVDALAQAGADILAVQIDDGDQAVRVAAEHGRRCFVYVCDQNDKQQVAELFPRILSDGHDPTVLVSCTGINRRGAVVDFQQEWLDELFQVNTISQFLIARDFVRHRIARKKLGGATACPGSNGKIIFLASNSSYQGGVRIPGYAATKSAILGMIRSFSNEAAPDGIQVNGIAPGYVDTTFTSAITADKKFKQDVIERIPAGRWGVPDDFRGAVVYLASAASNYTTGHSMVIDGGCLVR